MKSKLRFGVRSADGRTTNVWTCWTTPTKGDLYLTSDALGKALKFSNHPSGRSHIAYHPEKRDELFSPEAMPSERFILKHDDAEHTGSLPWLVASLYFPAGSPDDVPRDAPPETLWLPEAPPGQATEVGIFRNNVPFAPNVWPGKSEGSRLVGHLAFADASGVSAVWRHSEFQMPQAIDRPSRPGLFKGRTEADLLEVNRAVLFGTSDTGAFTLTEIKVSVTRNA